MKSGIKNGTQVTLNLSSNVIGNSNDETNFPHQLTNTQVLRLRKAFANNSSADIKLSSANIKLSKTQLHKIGHSGEFLGRILGPLLKTGLSLMKSVLKPLAKRVLIPLGLIAATSATDAAIQKEISNEEMNGIMKIVKSLDDAGLLIKGLSETIENEAIVQRGGFLSMLLGTLGSSLLGNLLTGKEVMRVGEGNIRAGEGTIRAIQDF